MTKKKKSHRIFWVKTSSASFIFFVFPWFFTGFMSLKGKGKVFFGWGGKASLWLERGAETFPWVEGNSLGEGQEPFFVEGGTR